MSQTLKVFSAISRLDVQDSPARHDEGQRKKPLGSCRNPCLNHDFPDLPDYLDLQDSNHGHPLILLIMVKTFNLRNQLLRPIFHILRPPPV